MNNLVWQSVTCWPAKLRSFCREESDAGPNRSGRQIARSTRAKPGEKPRRRGWTASGRACPPSLRQSTPGQSHPDCRCRLILIVGAPVQTGEEQAVRVRHDEGVAIRIDPKPCVGLREGNDE